MYTKNIKRISKEHFKGKVYNFSVADDHNYVANGCLVSNCHEMSDKNGQHGDLNKIVDIWSTQMPGTELAIGGGNPLAHPGLYEFLRDMRRMKIISNVTVNIMHMKKFKTLVQSLQADKMIYGLGISYRGPKSLALLPEDIDYKNVVFHLIMGIHDLNDCRAVIKWCKERNIVPKILLLGYKTFGNGIHHYTDELKKTLDVWQKVYLQALVNSVDNVVVSFDNLAISQLDLKNQLKPEVWDNLFQGDDMTHTFYIDAVKCEVAGTSTSSKRFKYTGKENIVDIFNLVKIDY